MSEFSTPLASEMVPLELFGDAASSQSAANWYALYTMPRHEKRVTAHLGVRDIECFLPSYQVKRRWNDGSRVTLELPLFPNYVFVHIPWPERVRVLTVPGALSIVSGSDKQRAAIPDAELEALRDGLAVRSAEPHPLTIAGQRVRIRCGPFGGMTGIVKQNRNQYRVVLTLDLIMQSISVEADVSELEPVAD